MTRLIDADALKETIFKKTDSLEDLWDTAGVLNAINNAPTVPLPDFKEGYKQAIIDGKTQYQRPKGEWVNKFDRLGGADMKQNDSK